MSSPVNLLLSSCCRFSKLLAPALLEEVDNINDPRCRVDIKKLLELPELKVNPFNVQLCRVFSGGRESLLFEEFLDMMSVLSEYTPSNVNILLTSLIHMTHHSDLQVKAEWAFKMFDFDGDGKLNKDDIYKTVSALTGSTDIEGREAQDRLEREKVSGGRQNSPTGANHSVLGVIPRLTAHPPSCVASTTGWPRDGCPPRKKMHDAPWRLHPPSCYFS